MYLQRTLNGSLGFGRYPGSLKEVMANYDDNYNSNNM